MTNGYAPLMYLLILEHERELARDSEISRLARDFRDATDRQRPAPAEPSISPRFGLGRLTRRALTGGA
ncbi:MAG TPA: hypothetical protein VIR16_13215 [Candidatus Limnocylindrales bacterium]